MTTITIRDVQCSSSYTLDGDRLTMTDDGGCRDALARSGVRLSEAMGDEAIRDAVYAAWATGYEGSPESNGLAVRVNRA